MSHEKAESTMGLRFRNSFKILPGLRGNLSFRGIGFSLGGRGITHSMGPGGSRTTVGLPGTGLSYTAEHGPK